MGRMNGHPKNITPTATAFAGTEALKVVVVYQKWHKSLICWRLFLAKDGYTFLRWVGWWMLTNCTTHIHFNEKSYQPVQQHSSLMCLIVFGYTDTPFKKEHFIVGFVLKLELLMKKKTNSDYCSHSLMWPGLTVVTSGNCSLNCWKH